MNYVEKLHDKTEQSASYHVFDGENKVAEFSYHIEEVVRMSEENTTVRCEDEFVTDSLFQPVREQVLPQFWLDEVKLSDSYRTFETMEPVLLFVQYKCYQKHLSDIYIRIHAQNLFYLKLYRQFGFYMIAEEQKEDVYGRTEYEYILKYAVPCSREDQFRVYVKRKEWR